MSDLISRKALCEYALNQKNKSITPNDIMRFPSAQPEKRTDKCTETHACDCIERQAAIDHLKKRLYETALNNNTEHPYYEEIADNRVDIWLNELPSAQPEVLACGEGELIAQPERTGRWIPCSERLPEPRKAVLGYAPRYQNIYALYYDSAYGWMIWNPLRDDCFPNSQGEIVAWMPLPEAYRGEGD